MCPSSQLKYPKKRINHKLSNEDRIVIFKAREDHAFANCFLMEKHINRCSAGLTDIEVMLMFQKSNGPGWNEKGSRAKVIIKPVYFQSLSFLLFILYFRRSSLYRNKKTFAQDLILWEMKAVGKRYKCLNADHVEGTVLDPVLYPHRT